jgi:L-seryl-tRNA(Ser) seleniumtransferase
MTYAALEATLRIYERGAATEEIPVIRSIASTRDQIAERALHLVESIANLGNAGLTVTLEDGWSVIGGGSAPEVKLPTVLVALRSTSKTSALLEQQFRGHTTPIIARTERDRVMIDLRTVEPGEDAMILGAISALAQPAADTAASLEVSAEPSVVY